MAFEELRERVKETAVARWGEIQASQPYQQLREQYDGLAPGVQVLVRFGGSLLAFLIIISIPYLWYSGASTSLAEFEDSRTLLKQALTIANQLKSAPETIPQLSAPEVKSRVEVIVNGMGLVPEQIKEVTEMPFSSPPGSSLIPKQFTQNGVQIRLGKLNLRQIVDITYKLQTMPDGTKVLGLEIERTPGETNYYDFSARVVSFNVESRGAEKSPTGGKEDKPAPKEKASFNNEPSEGGKS